MSQRDDDLKMLDELLDRHLHDLSDRELEAFADMRWDLKAYQGNETHRSFEFLTDKQRLWLTTVHQRIVPKYGDYVIPPPKRPGEPGYVALMVGTLPKKPPPMPQDRTKIKGPFKIEPMTIKGFERRPFKATGLDEKEDDE